ncbi:MAG: glycosyltransferase [Flavobacteriales bacterium]
MSIKILHINTYDALGGAARAARRIFQSQRAAGINCEMMVLHKSGSDPFIKTPQSLTPQKNLQVVHHLLQSYRLQKYSRNTILHSFGDASAGIVDEINNGDSDIVHLHWISGMLSVDDIAKITKPIVWTLHDMWAFCGSEHICFDEQSYFYSPPSVLRSVNDEKLIADLSKKTWLEKCEKWKNAEFSVVAPSSWLAHQARRSYLFKNSSVQIIPYPLDADTAWTPSENRSVVRNKLKITDDRKIILFVAKNPLNDLNKGWDLALQALQKVMQEGSIHFDLVVVGQDDGIRAVTPFTSHWVGSVNNDTELAEWYSAADVLLVPSRVEAFSQVTAEAQSCALPVVGFSIGGIPDIVIHRQTGYVARAYDTDDFADGILWVLSDNERRKTLSVSARKNIVEKFSPGFVSDRYMELYSSIKP